MPANGRWDLIRRLKVNICFMSQVASSKCYCTQFDHTNTHCTYESIQLFRKHCDIHKVSGNSGSRHFLPIQFFTCARGFRSKRRFS